MTGFLSSGIQNGTILGFPSKSLSLDTFSKFLMLVFRPTLTQAEVGMHMTVGVSVTVGFSLIVGFSVTVCMCVCTRFASFMGHHQLSSFTFPSFPPPPHPSLLTHVQLAKNYRVLIHEQVPET